jgi:hypothetical protein
MTLKTNIQSMKKTLVLIALAAGLSLAAQPALASGGAKHPHSGRPRSRRRLGGVG